MPRVAAVPNLTRSLLSQLLRTGVFRRSELTAWQHWCEKTPLEAAGDLASAAIVNVAPAAANAAAAEAVGVTVAVAAADASCDTSQQPGQDSFIDWEGYVDDEDDELVREFASPYASPASVSCSPRSPFTDPCSVMTSKSASPAFSALDWPEDFNLPPALFDNFSLRSRTVFLS